MPNAHYVSETTPHGIRVTAANPLFFDAFRKRSQRLEQADLKGLPECRFLDTSPPSRVEDLHGGAVEVRSIEDARELALACADLLAGLHSQGVVHGALCRAGLRLENAEMVLGGPAPLLTPGMDTSPDVFAGGPPCPRMDVWALGQLMQELGNEVEDDLLCKVGAWTTSNRNPALRPSLADVRERLTERPARSASLLAGATSVGLALFALSFLL